MRNKSVYQLVENLSRAKQPSLRNKIIGQIELYGEEAVPEILDYAKGKYPQQRSKDVLEILRAIGYPVNQKGLSYIVGIASDINNSEWELAVALLKDVGKPAISLARKYLRHYIKCPDENSLYIQSLCQFLAECQSELIIDALPELIHIAESDGGEFFIDIYSFDPIKRIGSPKADVVVPALIDKLVSRRPVEIKSAIISLLDSLDTTSIKPYIGRLKKFLPDCESEIINDLQNLVAQTGI